MIDIEAETLIPLSRAAREYPGGPVHVATLHRWRQTTTGPRLGCVRGARGWATSREAMRRHVHARTAAAMGQAPDPVSTMSAASLSTHRRAERELAAAGM